MVNIPMLLIALRERLELGDIARASRIADAILRAKGY
jgi:hypothetical protein